LTAVQIAAEVGADSTFIEKDWYSVQVLRALASYQSDTICTIFSGGNSLFKGYGMVQRFSEDLGFHCGYLVERSSHQYRKVRSAYRTNIIETLSSLDHVELNENGKVLPVTVLSFN
jgi:predicted nucleotidyltransferase component of viral defense system